MDELKTRSIRADDSTYDKFKKIASDEFGNQGQCLEALINLYETELSKGVLVERKLEIESFQDYLNKLQKLFLTSLQLNQDAEDRIRDEFAKQLTIKDNAIIDLREKSEQLKQENQSNKTKLEEFIAKYKDLEKLNESLEKEKVTLEELIKKNDELLAKNKDEISTLASLVTEYKLFKEKNEELMEQLKADNQYITDLQTTIKEKTMEINSSNKEIENLGIKISELKEEVNIEKTENAKLRSEHKKEIERLEAKFNERLKTEINNLKSNYDEKLELELKSKDTTIKSLQDQIELMKKNYEERLELERKTSQTTIKSLESDLKHKSEIQKLIDGNKNKKQSK